MSIVKIGRTADSRNILDLEKETENVYLSCIIISKRANQIGENIKEELHSKLEEFAYDSDNLEEIHENREQIEISSHYEKMPKPTLLSTQEFLESKIHWRIPEKHSDEQPEA